ncbi:uncharacterized protein LOC142321339 isoform X1 [Lycorma delicatula]|uniref:uncharacterized protein LOC142321339 isoform X1 n=1 Tax=Lycorma delicatula TaxID=130591 RepID=UPI003F519D0A
MVHIHAVTHQNLEEDMLYRCLVDSGAIGKVEDRKVTCTITNPSRSLTENHITSLADGTYRIGCYTPFEEVVFFAVLQHHYPPVPSLYLGVLLVHKSADRLHSNNELEERIRINLAIIMGCTIAWQ